MSKKKKVSVDLDAIMSEVQSEMDLILKSEKTKLAKAAEGESTETEVEPDDSATDPSGDDGGEAPAEASGGDSDGGDGPPAGDAGGAPAAEGSAPGGDPSMGGDPAMDQGPVTVEQLQPEYMKLDPESLKMHYLACKAALFAVMGGGDDQMAPPDAGMGDPAAAGPPGGDPSMGAAPAGPPAGPAGPPPAPAGGPMGPPAGDPNQMPPDAPPALKGEMAPSGKQVPNTGKDVNGGKEIPVAKSETEIKLEAMEKGMGLMLNALEGMLTKPIRKAVTGTAFIDKNGSTGAEKTKVDVSTLTKSEAVARLKNKSQDATLSKKDRELIASYTLGSIGIDKVAHLFDE